MAPSLREETATLWEGHVPAFFPAQACRFPLGGQAAVSEIAPAASVPRELIHLGGKCWDQHSLLHCYMTEDVGFQLQQHFLSWTHIYYCVSCSIICIHEMQLTVITMSEVAWTSHIFFKYWDWCITSTRIQNKKLCLCIIPLKTVIITAISIHQWQEIHSKAKQQEKGKARLIWTNCIYKKCGSRDELYFMALDNPSDFFRFRHSTSKSGLPMNFSLCHYTLWHITSLL